MRRLRSIESVTPPTLHLEETGTEGGRVVLEGRWDLQGFRIAHRKLRTTVAQYGQDSQILWDLSGIEAIDSTGAFILWRSWGNQFPEHIRLQPEHKPLFQRWQGRVSPLPEKTRPKAGAALKTVARGIAVFFRNLLQLIALLGQLVLDLVYLIIHPTWIPWREISANIHEAGGRALGITALVGVLIGVVLSYLSANQLKTFGAQAFLVNILGMSILRELGPMLAAVLIAGRSGSAITAQLGVMRVNQELDALAVLGISRTMRLVLPKVIALFIALPLLALWTDALALLGGMVSAHQALDMGYFEFLSLLPAAVPVFNLLYGVAKAAVFGVLIALISSHFGLLAKPNTRSLARETTNSVVASITLVIVVDAVFAIAFEGWGWL